MLTADIRRRFLDYFVSKGHEAVPSASLVSPDPSVLFTIAGMVPFIPYLTGRQTPPYPRAASAQKCVRTADIDEVGVTTRHGTFFTMCGNFSFGDYFKNEAIEFAWEFSTGSEQEGKLGLPADRIWVTVLEGDDESVEAWKRIAGLPDERIQRRDRNDNYWQTGQPGPGGPCSEMYYDRGPEYGAEGGPIVDEDRYLEFWNLVFMQHQLSAVRSKVDFDIAGDLPNKNIDTGLGVERVALIKQGVENFYETDELFAVISAASKLSGVAYGENEEADVRLRIVADHVRSALMLIGDGIRPSNEGRGYVLRRLLRRTVRSMRLLGVDEPSLPHLFPVSMETMSVSYPEVREQFDFIAETAYAEEETFRRTLTSGITILDTAVAKAKSAGSKKISGDDAFALHDTYGFPIELTLEIAGEQGVDVDESGFKRLMKEQKERARADAKAKKQGSGSTAIYQQVAKDLSAPVQFIGYTDLEGESEVKAVLVDGEARRAHAGDSIDLILDRTPFYAEAGGQLADQGLIQLAGGTLIEVDDVQKPLDGLIVHRARVVEGEVEPGMLARSSVDAARRKAVARAHTATHLVHKALQEALGDGATQAGSENGPGRLRFDFRSTKGMAPDELLGVEQRVNEIVSDDMSVTDKIMSMDAAMELGAQALFGEKYGNEVRVVSVGDWSRELCGGTHAGTSGQLGVVKLLSESSIGSGVRRVEALVGTDAYGYLAREHALVSQLTDLLRVQPGDLVDRVGTMVTQLKDADRELAKIRTAQLLQQSAGLASDAEDIGGVLSVIHDAGDIASADDVRTLVTDIRGKLGDSRPSVVAVFGASKGRPQVVVATNGPARDAGLRAGDLVKTAAGALGGGGGGKPDLAQGGGQNIDAIDDAIAAVRSVVREATA